jgi:tyrosyl-tRNA synthetase
MSNEFANVYEELEWREALHHATPGAQEVLATQKVTCYNGFDPTARSLHIGNLVPIMGLVRMQRHGHRPIAIVGGGTGMIGDPSGKSEERQLLSVEQIDENVENIRKQLESFLDFSPSISNPAQVINNADWLRKLSLLDFLRDVGKHFSVNTMLGRESVKARMERESGISFTEFSYQLIQAYDFLVLYEKENCTFQMGGSDQWGNILGGIELIRRVHGREGASSGGDLAHLEASELPAHALAYPLITTSTGEKFGKSVGGAPTLDPEQTSPYRLYQFFINVADADVVKYLKLFTLLGKREISALEEAVRTAPREREAQRALAAEMTRIVHGQAGLDEAQRITRALFEDDLGRLTAKELRGALTEAGQGKIPAQALREGITLANAVTLHGGGLITSTSELRRLASQGAVKVNGKAETDPLRKLGPEDFIDGQVMVVQRGRKSHELIWLEQQPSAAKRR